MKIGWATPLHHASAAGRSSVGAAEAIARSGCKVDILRTERATMLSASRLPCRLKIRPMAKMRDYHALRKYDLVVYNIADDAELHSHAVDAAMRVPGICIFHDHSIVSLFNGWTTERGMTDQIPAMIEDIYGPGGQGDGEGGKAAADRPMLEWLTPYALGAVAHGRHYVPRLTASCAGPVRHIPPAYDLPETIPPLRQRSKTDPLTVTTTGAISAETPAAEIIKALADAPHLRRQCKYRLAGPVSDELRRTLGGLAENLGVSVHMTGALSRSQRVRELAGADAILCLGKPGPEGTSASAVEAMLAGRPVVVPDHGFYRDLPDELTVKLPPDFEPGALADRLSWLADHPEECRVLGKDAASWARETFSSENYARAFLELAEKALEAEPLLSLGTQLGQELLALGAGKDDPAAIRLGEQAAALFSSGGMLCRQI